MALGIGIGLSNCFLPVAAGSSGPVPVPLRQWDFTNAGSYTPGQSYTVSASGYGYTCATGSRYCQYSATQVASGIAADKAPIGLYGLALWPATTNGLTNPLTESAGWNPGSSTITTGRTDPAGGTTAIRGQATTAQVGNYFNLTAAGVSQPYCSYWAKTETSSNLRWAVKGTAYPNTALTATWTKYQFKSTAASNFWLLSGASGNGFATAEAYDITHAFPMCEQGLGRFGTDFHDGARASAAFRVAPSDVDASGRLMLYVAHAPGCSVGGANDGVAALTLATAGSGYSITVHQLTGVVTVTSGGVAYSTPNSMLFSLAAASTDVIEYWIEVGGGGPTVVKARWKGGTVVYLGQGSAQPNWDTVNPTYVLSSSTTAFPGWIQKITTASVTILSGAAAAAKVVGYQTYTRNGTAVRLYWVGNSLTYGFQSVAPSSLVATDPNRPSAFDTITNYGVNSATTGAVTGSPWDLTNAYPTTVRTQRVPGLIQIVSMLEIGNDLKYSIQASTPFTARQLVDRYWVYANLAMADGYIFIPHVPFARKDLVDVGGAATIAAARLLILAEAASVCGHSIMCDLSVVPELNDTTNTTYFQNDQIHLTATGSGVLEREQLAAVNRYLNSVGMA